MAWASYTRANFLVQVRVREFLCSGEGVQEFLMVLNCIQWVLKCYTHSHNFSIHISMLRAGSRPQPASPNSALLRIYQIIKYTKAYSLVRLTEHGASNARCINIMRRFETYIGRCYKLRVGALKLVIITFLLSSGPIVYSATFARANLQCRETNM